MKYVLVLALLLTGCATCKEPIIPPSAPIVLDARVYEPCKPLVVPTEEDVSFETILVTTRENTVIYTECKTKYDAAIVLIKKLTNKKD